MIFPELLYAPRVSDIAKQITQAQRYVRAFDKSSASLQVADTTDTVPLDQVLLLSHVSLRATAGAAQNFTQWDVFVQNTLGTFAYSVVQTGGNGVNLVIRGSVAVMPEERIQVRATFDAAAAANRIEATVWGFLIPRANLIDAAR